MDAITLDAIVSVDRQLVVDLPPDVPAGPLKLTIQPANNGTSKRQSLTREAARAKLLAAGALVTDFGRPGKVLSDEEFEELTQRVGKGRSVEELVDEDRGLY